MIKKLLFLLVIAFCYSSALSQTVTPNKNDCVQNFTLEASLTSGDNPRVGDILISYDFSKNSNAKNLVLTFEVQPLNSCWNGLDGKNRSEAKKFKVNSLSQNDTGIQKLEYTDLNCKCIKWKAKIVNMITNCETITDWQFTSFL
ncbi:MAG: hypothetical protein KDD03_12240, partial [Gelidibacter sp.]|nr:hypothetical protein [Gelidibacter sp.]